MLSPPSLQANQSGCLLSTPDERPEPLSDKNVKAQPSHKKPTSLYSICEQSSCPVTSYLLSIASFLICLLCFINNCLVCTAYASFVSYLAACSFVYPAFGISFSISFRKPNCGHDFSPSTPQDGASLCRCQHAYAPVLLGL